MSARKTALIIDDAASIRTFIKISLDAGGWIVHEAGSVAGGRKQIAEHAPDLIILDLGLPDGDGLEILQALAEQDAFAHISPRVIVLTVRKDPDTKQSALRLGAHSFLTKPFDMETLLELVD